MKRSNESEMMDAPDQPVALLIDDLRNLRIINAYLGNYRNVLRGLKRLVGVQKKFSLLDVGTGSADIPATIARWARRQRIGAHISGLEPNSVSLGQAAEQTREFPEISLLRADGMTLPFQPHSFDFVLASQLLHHYSEENIVGFLRSWAQVARQGIIVSDLIRHPLAYYSIHLLTRLFTRNVMTRTDGPLSVRRGLTMAEWRQLFRQAGVGSCEVHWAFPFRVLALISLRAST
ncbi:MAG TPA: methyltransferase domain-containing protein [Acidobacteriota bacterium]|nr:methyltransferase domain-containing protein [Acidobacteriota bacterium]